MELANKQVRLYESDYNWVTEAAKERRTIAAEIINEALDAFKDSLKAEKVSL